MASDLFAKGLSPEKLFRIVILFCLVAMGCAMIYVASHASQLGPLPENFSRIRDLTSYFFTALWVFVFFYAQYRLVPRLTKMPLDNRFGYAQSLGAAALLMVGALHTVLPQTSADVPSGILYWITLLGEAVFIGNVVWSYTHAGEAVPVLPVVGAKPRPAEGLRDERVKDLGWPKSPVKLFTIGAGFFAIGGLVSLILSFPSFKFPVPWSGEMHFLPFGLLWMACAVPFVIFAMLYQFFGDSYGLAFEDSMNRIHFFVTIVAALVMVRFFSDWQQAMVSKSWAFYFTPQFGWLYLLLSLSALVFAINAFRSYRRAAVKR
ncbi:MAG TPA: hypothetical protein VE263_00970 [Candidatus Angelobacter sp.]|nr:hypothetical protein [Candidatus Angelobacter sp.]